MFKTREENAMKKNYMRTLAAVLAAVLVVTVQPSYAFAADIDDITEEAVAEDVIMTDAEEEPDQEDTLYLDEEPGGEEDSAQNEEPGGKEDSAQNEEPGQEEAADSDELNADPGESDASGEVKDDAEAEPDADETEAGESDKDAFPGLEEDDFQSVPGIEEEKEELRERLDDIENALEGIDYKEDEIITAAPDEETALLYAEAFSGTLVNYEYGYALIRFDPDDAGEDISAEDAILASADPDTLLPAAWPNYIYELYEDEDPLGIEPASLYSDPDLKSNSGSYQWQHFLMESEAAWNAGYTGSGIRVTVIDTGVIDSHEDLSITNRAKYNDSTAKLVDGSATDGKGHGTHCTGIIGAKNDNGKGGAGIAPKATMSVVNACDSSGSLDGYAIYLGIEKAVFVWQSDIISMSLGSAFEDVMITDGVEDAYKNGVAVFAASGNGCSTDQISYPAACKHAIAVGAVDKGNARIFFSNQSSKVRYSGPGVQIYSTGFEGSSSYVSKSGTSMATPCVAGAAAVILSSGRVTGTRSSERVDKLLQQMDKSCVSSGIGKGTPNLAKYFGSGSAMSAPLSPVASLPGTYPYASISVTLNSEKGTTIYYTTDGSKITYKNGTVSEGAEHINSNTGTVTITGSASVTLNAMAVSSVNGLSSKQVSYVYKLQPKVSAVEITAPNGVACVQKGSSIQLGTKITPAYAKDQAVTWTVTSPATPTGISVSSSGRVSVAKNATASELTVKATAKDGSGKSATIRITVKETDQVASIKPDASNVTVYNGQNGNIGITVKLASGSEVSSADYVTWVPEDSKTATCSSSGKTLTVTGVKAGKTVINGMAKDGSGKKASVSVTVLQKATGITVSGPTQVAAGKNIKPSSVTISPADVSTKKVKWELNSVPQGTDKNRCGVKVNSTNGQITAAANAVRGTYTARATVDDPSGKYATYTFSVIAEPIKTIKVSESDIRLFRKTNSNGAPTSKSFTVAVTGGNSSNLSVKSSEPGIVTASISGTTVTVTAKGASTGKANVTVETTDGSNLKKTVKVEVANPVSRLYLSAPAGRSKDILQYGKTMKLTPLFITEYGSADAISKRLTWRSSNTNYLTVDSTGTVKAVNSRGYSGPVTITASTTDGSNVSASYSIYPNGSVKRLYGSFTQTHVNRGVLTMTASCIGTSYAAYSVSVKGPADGVSAEVSEDNSRQIVIKWGNKKGRYSVKVSRNDGGNQSYTYVINVR